MNWYEQKIDQLRATITEQQSRIKELEDALREAKESISDLAFWDNGKPEFESAHLVIAAINELIGE